MNDDLLFLSQEQQNFRQDSQKQGLRSEAKSEGFKIRTKFLMKKSY